MTGSTIPWAATNGPRGCAGRLLRWIAACGVLGSLVASAAMPAWVDSGDSASLIVVAIDDKPGAPRAVDALQADIAHDSGDWRSSAARQLANEYGLVEVAAWTVDVLQLRCIVFRPALAGSRDELLRRLRTDRRVRIAQPLHEFRTFGTSRSDGTSPLVQPGYGLPGYDDPYHGLQTSFGIVQAQAAQRWAVGQGSRIAIIDTAIDVDHLDLAGQVIEQHDLLAPMSKGSTPTLADRRHGTEVAGVISALANNGIGIVGIAPEAKLLSYRACWSHPGDGRARCNSLTLAMALAAAIAADARIIHLSLGGPADPLLQQLLAQALKRGAIVVGAVPPGGRSDGFPVGVRGVVAVASDDEDDIDESVLRAPGRDILTLQPGGHYDFASGSSLAAAAVTGAIALMLEIKPSLNADAARDLLKRSEGSRRSINICGALASLRGIADPSCPATGTSKF